MPNTKSYIETTPLLNDKQKSVFFDSEIQKSLDNFIELVIKIFDATACSVLASPIQTPIELCQRGSKITLTKDDLKNSSNTTVNINSNILRVVTPINLPSHVQFGWIVFERQSDIAFTEKEKSIFLTLKNGLINQLAQRRHLLEATDNAELQLMISELNKDLVCIEDEHFKIVYANDAFKNMYPENMQNNIIGCTTVESYEDDKAKNFLAQDKIALHCGFSQIVEKLCRPNGSSFTADTVKRRFEDRLGNLYILTVSKDITEKEQLIHKIEAAQSELNEFTSIASHDLRSPLNAIKRLLEWISDDCKDMLPKEHLENFQLVINRTNRMQVLLEDLLSYSRINSCDGTLASISLDAIYLDIKELLNLPKTLTVNINANNQLITIPVIPFKIVISNLIGNAVKHNDKKNPIIDISLLPDENYYVIEIKDNGPGIEPKYFSLIFKLFQTLQSRDDVEGSGIGLCIAKKHIMNYGGKIEVTSDGKLGSTFTVYWPKK